MEDDDDNSKTEGGEGDFNLERLSVDRGQK